MSDMSYNMYQPYMNGLSCAITADNILNSLQHQAITKAISDSASDIVGQISATDKNTSQAICSGVMKVTDTIGSQSLGLRDSIERNGTNINTNLTTMGQYNADRARDIQTTVERTAQQGSNITERNSSQILQAIERNAGESRYVNAVNDATTRQANNDLARDIIQQTNRGTNELVAAIATAIAATNSSAYETRNLLVTGNNQLQTSLLTGNNQLQSNILIGNNQLQNSIYQTRDAIALQGANQYASMLLEQQKVKECLSIQMAEAKYEALKNKEVLAAQLAASSCEAKYEALKNTQTLAAQLAECCCEIKTSIKDSTASIDDTLRTLDTQRLRDKLNVTQNDVNLLKVTEHETNIIRNLDQQNLRDALNVARNEINLLKSEKCDTPRYGLPYIGGFGLSAYNGYGPGCNNGFNNGCNNYTPGGYNQFAVSSPFPGASAITQIQLDPYKLGYGRNNNGNNGHHNGITQND